MSEEKTTVAQPAEVETENPSKLANAEKPMQLILDPQNFDMFERIEIRELLRRDRIKQRKLRFFRYYLEDALYYLRWVFIAVGSAAVAINIVQ